jgi:hypothetical protein
MAHSMSARDLGHFESQEFVKACAFKIKFMWQCFDYDIPYAGGIDVSGQIYFQDRSIPRWFYDGGDEYVGCDVEYSPTGERCWYLPDFWMIHERIEWEDEAESGRLRRAWLCAEWWRTRDRGPLIGPDEHFDYQPCHQIAELTEERLVVESGLDLAKYVRMCDRYVEQVSAKIITHSPAVLYLQPYEDEEDWDVLDAIAQTGGPKSYALYDKYQSGGHDGAVFWGA